jgi:hypothetical protein
MPNLMEIRLVGADMFLEDGRTDRQTDMTKVIIAFRNLRTCLKTFQESRFSISLQLSDIRHVVSFAFAP